MNCFDAAKLVIDEFSESIKDEWVVNNEYLDVLKQYCSYIDRISDEFLGDGLHVNVDEEIMTINIVVEVPTITVDDVNHLYCRLIQKTVAFGFSADAETDHVLVSFTFPRVWDRREP